MENLSEKKNGDSMNIYGSALPNGIILCSDNVKVKVTKTKDNNMKIDTAKLNTKQDSPNKNVLLRIPFIRGIFSMLFYNTSKSYKYIVFMMCFTDFMKFTKHDSILNTSILKVVEIVFFIILAYLIIKIRPILQYHAVEHKVVNTYENHKEINYANVKIESRVNYRCGTVFALFAAFFCTIAYLILHYTSIALLIAIAIASELFPIEGWEKRPLIKYLYAAGGFLQEHFTTIEPKEDQIKLGIVAMNELIKLNNEAQ